MRNAFTNDMIMTFGINLRNFENIEITFNFRVFIAGFINVVTSVIII